MPLWLVGCMKDASAPEIVPDQPATALPLSYTGPNR